MTTDIGSQQIVRKSKTVDLRIGIKENLRGRQYLEIRQFVGAARGRAPRGRVPTDKGVTIGIGQITALREAIEAAEAEARELGLLQPGVMPTTTGAVI